MNTDICYFCDQVTLTLVPFRQEGVTFTMLRGVAEQGQARHYPVCIDHRTAAYNGESLTINNKENTMSNPHRCISCGHITTGDHLLCFPSRCGHITVHPDGQRRPVCRLCYEAVGRNDEIMFTYSEDEPCGKSCDPYLNVDDVDENFLYDGGVSEDLGGITMVTDTDAFVQQIHDLAKEKENKRICPKCGGLGVLTWTQFMNGVCFLCEGKGSWSKDYAKPEGWITCGNCRKNNHPEPWHASAAEVKDCYQNR